MKIKEVIMINSSVSNTKRDDENIIINELKSILNNRFISLDKIELLKEFENTKEYKVTYTYKETSTKSKDYIPII